MTRLVTATQIIIAPGYHYHIVQGMVTNFHQPQSTLLLLVSAFVDGRWREIYDYALAHGFPVPQLRRQFAAAPLTFAPEATQ